MALLNADRFRSYSEQGIIRALLGRFLLQSRYVKRPLRNLSDRSATPKNFRSE